MSRGVRTALVALVGALLGAVLITWPAVLDLDGGLIGHPGNDTWNHVWGFWWYADAFANRGGLPLHTGLLNYPSGGTLFFIDNFNALLSIPLQWLFSLPVTYNLLVIGAVAWTIFGAWMLAHHVLRDPLAASVAAAVYGCSAHLLGQTYNGITETVNAGWIPLFVLALMRTLERPRLGRGLVMGVVLGCCALSNFYYGLFAILLGIVAVLHQAIRDPWRVNWKHFLSAAAAGAVLFAGMVLPVLQVLSMSMDAADAMVSRDPQFVWDSLLRHNITDVVSFFKPGKHYSPDLKAQYGEDLIIVIYLGWVALGLALLGFALHRRRKETAIWWWILVVFWVFSLGPYLHVDGEYVRVAGRTVPLPFLPFFEAFPIFSRISHPFRFVVPAMLGLGILAGDGARLLLRGLSPAARMIGTACLVGAITAEVLLASPAVWPLPRAEATIPSAYDELEAPGAVLDLPITVPNLERAVYTYYQTAHGRPSPYGLNEPLPGPLRRNRLTHFLVNIEAGRVATLPRLLPDLELVSGAKLLAREGYAYIVVHDRLLPQHKRAMVETVLTAVVGPPRKYPEDGVSLYALR